MRASYDLRADLTLLTTNKMSGGQQLFGSNNLVIAGREQENRASYCRKINRASECCETPSCKLIVFVEPLNDLEIIGAGEIDGARVPFAKERDQPQAARRSDIIRNLQQAVNCFGFDPPPASQHWKMQGAGEMAIGCERCHGPGSKHVEAAKQKEAEGSKLNPDRDSLFIIHGLRDLSLDQ